jgi:hypothetical protein
MRRRGLWAACAVLLLGIVGVLAVGTGFANDEDAAGAKCSEATLDGTYLFVAGGSIVKGNNQGPTASAGYQVFNGNGKVDQVSSVNLNGNVFRDIRDIATYKVKADCTGTSTYITDGVRYQTDLFIAPDGSMFTWVQTNPPERVTSGFELRGTARRVGE